MKKNPRSIIKIRRKELENKIKVEQFRAAAILATLIGHFSKEFGPISNINIRGNATPSRIECIWGEDLELQSEVLLRSGVDFKAQKALIALFRGLTPNELLQLKKDIDDLPSVIHVNEIRTNTIFKNGQVSTGVFNPTEQTPSMTERLMRANKLIGEMTEESRKGSG